MKNSSESAVSAIGKEIQKLESSLNVALASERRLDLIEVIRAVDYQFIANRHFGKVPEEEVSLGNLESGWAPLEGITMDNPIEKLFQKLLEDSPLLKPMMEFDPKEFKWGI